MEDVKQLIGGGDKKKKKHGITLEYKGNYLRKILEGGQRSQGKEMPLEGHLTPAAEGR